MRANSHAILLAALALAGCLAAPVAPVPRAPPERVELSACTSQAGLFPLAPGEAERFLPPGFAPAVGQGDRAAPAPVLGVVGFDCERGLVDGIPIGSTRELWWILLVDAPAAYRSPTANGSWAILGIVPGEDASVAWLASWGIALARGEVALALGPESPASREGSVRASNGSATVRLDTFAGGPPVRGGNGDLNRAFVVRRDAGGRPFVAAAFDVVEVPGLWSRGLPANPPGAGSATLDVQGDGSGVPQSAGGGAGFHEWSDATLFAFQRVALT